MNDGISRLWGRMRNMVGRGRTTLVDDSRAAQVHQVRMGADELRDGAPRVGEYGFASNPPPGTDVIMVFIAGDRSNGVIIATNNQTVRMRSLATGEVAIHDDKGRFVLLGAGGIHVQGKDDPIVVETTSDITATAGGNLAAHAGGDITASAGGNVALTAGSKITLTAPQVEIDATTMTVTAATTITGVTAIVGDTSIDGALTNNGHAAGQGHNHLPGTFKVGSSSVTGVSGVVTP